MNPTRYGIIDLDWTWKTAACAYQSLAESTYATMQNNMNFLVSSVLKKLVVS